MLTKISPQNWIQMEIGRHANQISNKSNDELITLYKSGIAENKGKCYTGLDIACNKVPESYYNGKAALTLLRERHGVKFVEELTGVKQPRSLWEIIKGE